MTSPQPRVQELEDKLWFAYNDLRRSPKTAVKSFQELKKYLDSCQLVNCEYCIGGMVYSASPTDDRECEVCQGFGLMLNPAKPL